VTWWHASSIKAQLKAWATQLIRDIRALWIAAGCVRTPVAAKGVAALVAAYAFSPIDLIPDFIPVLGLLDDLLLLPLGIMIALRLIPPDLMTRYRNVAGRRIAQHKSLWGAVIVAAIWGGALAFAVIVYAKA
jgi:uncharacterized membrane protein YkvA (DUF1232 family)